jgi:hypothetical protein
MYKKLHSVLVAVCLIPTTLMPSASLAAGSLEPMTSSSATPTYLAQNTYPPELVTVYMDACVGSASNTSISREMAISYCRCSIDRIQSNYTLEKFLELVQSASPGILPPELESIAAACVTSLTN